MAHIFHIFSLILLIFGRWAFAASSQNYAKPSNILERHQQWMAQYGRVYKDQIEEDQRFSVFKNNVEFIDYFNNIKGRSYRLSVNKFADLTNKEFASYRNGLRPSKNATAASGCFMYENVTNLPPTFDWREKGAMTPVKDQGECAVAAVEGITKIKTGKLVDLSVQEIVDCDKSSDNQGCDGGLMSKAFEFIQHNGGIATQRNYPYKGADGTCNHTQASIRVAKIKGFEEVPPSEEELLKAVANQPVSAGIDGSGLAFQFYSGGILDGDCGTDLSHGVTIIGYGTSNDGTKYWLVRNSWGQSWGEEGYFRLKRGENGKEGLCGIAKGASYPLA